MAVFIGFWKRVQGYLPAVAVAGMLSVFFVREMYYVAYSSSTFDEGQYASYGFSLLKKGDYRLANFKPNLVPLLSAVPLLAAGARLDVYDPNWTKLEKKAFSGDIWPFTLDFVHYNSIPADELLFYSRLPIIFLALLLGLAVYSWASRLYGTAGGLLSLALYTTCPNMLAHGGLVTEDMAFAFFSFATVYLYYLYNRAKTVPALLLAGAVLGFALNTKYTAVLLFPALAGYCLLEYRCRRAEGEPLRRGFLALGAVFAAAAVALLCFYGFPAIRYYLTGLYRTAVHIDGGQMAFLNGRYSVHGFWNYFIYALLVKTPLPTLLFAGFAAAAWLRERTFRWLEAAYLLLFPALLLASASASNFQIGLRHVLPVYPFLFVFCGGALKFFSGRALKLAPAAAALLFWQARASAGVHPYYLTYFNELAGGPARGHEHLLDSNLDWGQDLKALRTYLKEEKVSDLVLSYYGSTVPDYVGMEFQDLFSTIEGAGRYVNSAAPAKEYLAVSATNLHSLYFRKFGDDIFAWLKLMEPKAVIGNNIRVYDITSDARAHEQLANLYFMGGYPKKAERECRRALLLDPKSKFADFLLALVLIKEKPSERQGLALMRTYLGRNGYAAPREIGEFARPELFRQRYSNIALHAAKKMTEARNFREAAFLTGLSESIKNASGV